MSNQRKIKLDATHCILLCQKLSTVSDAANEISVRAHYHKEFKSLQQAQNICATVQELVADYRHYVHKIGDDYSVRTVDQLFLRASNTYSQTISRQLSIANNPNFTNSSPTGEIETASEENPDEKI